MGQQGTVSIGQGQRKVVEPAKPTTPSSGVYQPPPPGTLGALSNQMRKPQQPEGIDPITLLLLARQFPQYFAQMPETQSFDLGNAPTQQDDIMQTLMNRQVR